MSRRTAAGILVALTAALLPLGAPAAFGNHGNRTLDVAPEAATNQVNTVHTLAAGLSSMADPESGPINIDFEIEGPNDPDGGSTPTSPDRTCTIALTLGFCTVTYSGKNPGTDIIRSWIDDDKVDATVEADLAEERSGQATPGNVPEPDITDVVQVTWTALPAVKVSDLDCSPETVTNPAAGTGQTYTCTAKDNNGAPIPNVSIDGENLGGANDPDNNDTSPQSTADYDDLCVTGPDGKCSGSVGAGEFESGPADICFWADYPASDAAFIVNGVDADGGDCDNETRRQDDDDATDTVSQTWVAVNKITLSQTSKRNPVNSQHTVIANVRDEDGSRVEGVTVRFTATGVNNLTMDARTDANGNATFVYTGGPAPGDDTIAAFADLNNNGTRDAAGPQEPEAAPLMTTWAVPGLSLSPVSASNQIGSLHTVVATVNDQSLDPVPDGTRVSFTVAGTGQENPTSAVTTTSGGKASFAFTSAKVGRSTITATSGSLTATATATWTNERITLTPASATSPVGQVHTVTATVTDRFGKGLTWVPVRFTITGATPTIRASETTGSSGSASTDYVGRNVGDDTITAFADLNGDGTRQDTEPEATAAKTWLLRPASRGYWLVASDGGIFTFGAAPYKGSTGALKLNRPVVGMAATPSGEGYWLVASDGGIFSFGDAEFFGSTGAIKLNKPILGMAPTPSGKGYWMVASDGGIFSFGDAAFHGSTGAITLNKPVVGMAATPSGKGYWLVASDGGIFSFGDAEFFGSTGAIKLNKPVVGMAPTPSGKGYWMVASDGGIFSFGDAAFHGSTGAIKLNMPIVGMAATPSGKGYWLVASDGGIFSFGDAAFLGSTGAIKLNKPVVGMGRH